jgi:hypothetical protein
LSFSSVEGFQVVGAVIRIFPSELIIGAPELTVEFEFDLFEFELEFDRLEFELFELLLFDELLAISTIATTKPIAPTSRTAPIPSTQGRTLFFFGGVDAPYAGGEGDHEGACC